MPTYVFKCRKCGCQQVAVRTVDRRNDFEVCPECDDPMFRDIASEQQGHRHMPGNWPILSDALGCNPSQIHDSMEVAKQHGVPTQFTPDGRAILTSPAHRKAYARLYGIHDRNGGYSDP